MSCLSVDEARLSAKGYQYVWVGRPFKDAFVQSADIWRAPAWSLAFYKVW